MIRVVVFGAFDPLHDGHRNFFGQARALGDHLTIVLARDTTIRERKGRAPYQHEHERLIAVAAVPGVDDVRLGNESNDLFEIFSSLEVDVVALGYDQKPSERVITAELVRRGYGHIDVVRLQAYRPEIYKSSLVRAQQEKSV